MIVRPRVMRPRAAGSRPVYCGPLGEQQHDVGAGAGLLGGGGVGQVRPERLGVVEGGGVGDDDVRALEAGLGGDVEGGGVADVVAVRFERGAEDGDLRADERAACGVAGEVDGRGPAAHVDGVDLAQEGQGLVGAELAGAGAEGADVLGQAAAAEPDAGVEELAADAVVVADGVGEDGDVGAGGVGRRRPWR